MFSLPGQSANSHPAVVSPLQCLLVTKSAKETFDYLLTNETPDAKPPLLSDDFILILLTPFLDVFKPVLALWWIIRTPTERWVVLGKGKGY